MGQEITFAPKARESNLVDSMGFEREAGGEKDSFSPKNRRRQTIADKNTRRVFRFSPIETHVA